MKKKRFNFCKASITLLILKKKMMFINFYKNNFNGYMLNFLGKKNTHVDISSPGASLVFFKKKVNNINTKNIFFSQFFYFFEKIKFKGKGYKIKLNKLNRTLNFYFGHSHVSIIFLTQSIIKRIKKFKFIIMSTELKKIKNFSKTTARVKPLNLYTKRGLRLARQITKKRPGKKKTY